MHSQQKRGPLESQLQLLSNLMFKAVNLIANMANNLNRKVVFVFGGLPRAYLRPEQTQNTELISLSMEETQQLLSITPYSQSIEQLRKNNLHQSLIYLKFSLNESKEKYPYSVNLQNCLMNRISIILKLLNKTKEFQNILQEIYLTTVSAKGNRHLNTVKSLINYMIALTVYNPTKCTRVLEYLRERGELNDYLTFFEGLDLMRRKKDYKQGLSILKSLPQSSADEKIFKYNNLAFVKHQSLKQAHKNPIQYFSAVKKQQKQILNLYLEAIIEAESNLQQVANYTEQQIKQTETFVDDIRLYLQESKPQLFTSGSPNRKILKHSNSHIIAMNLAYLLFETQRTKECFYILQLALEKAIAEKELQRVGMALILLGRYFYLTESDRWEETYLDLLQHSKTYPRYVVKEALSTYGGLLMQKGRLLEAESYINQAFSIECESGLQGLILPSYDFSF